MMIREQVPAKAKAPPHWPLSFSNPLDFQQLVG
jgi:hypothetical protein